MPIPPGTPRWGSSPGASRPSGWPTRCSTGCGWRRSRWGWPIPGLDLVAPGDRLSLCSEQMGSVQGLGQGREFRIRRLLKGLTDYDVVVVDTSPVLTPLNVAILYAVAEILIPIDPCVAALAGVRALEDLIRTVSEFRMEFTDAGPLTIAGVLITRADRTLVSKQIESEVRAYFGAAGVRAGDPGLGEVPGGLRAGDPADPLRPGRRGCRCVSRGGPRLSRRRPATRRRRDVGRRRRRRC